ncbi:hypothetical protein J5N97_022993 [Dioscorea zingiberensis]|uniref:Chromosome transmission fidelity protein 8 n=1 Tax=Dioscorea zingiberensis TaxID=325984 RepID=A0A9D5CB64_9LILI|nr:hypothetical protein J5N97_022993 [Dioscorea zingiberensis]
MEIQVKCKCGQGECAEWAIVELQGAVESQASSMGSGVEGLEIGNLCCSSPGNFTFTVCYHELSGTKTALKKPLLVLRKRKDDELRSRPELEVIGIIRHRILFKTRPKALISRAQCKEKKQA